MNHEDRARILRMVADGKLSAQEAADLLDAIEPTPRTELPRPVSPVERPLPPAPAVRRSLVIRIDQGGASKVHLRIPLGLARTAGRFIPRQAQSRLAEYDINLEQLFEDLGTVTVEGPLLEIEDNEDRVLIAVE